MKISLITVCHKSNETIVNFVASFLKWHCPSSDRARYEFIFVENSGSQEIRESVRPLADGGYEIKVVDSDNEGFGAACNLGAKHSSGDLLVFVNPDVEFLCSLDPLVDFFDHASWGTVRQLTPRGRMHSIDLFPEHKNLVFELAKGYRFVNKYFRLFLKNCYVVGSFLVVEKNIFEQMGGFNTRFFLYYEEVELCRRLQACAGPPSIEEGVSVLHAGFGSHETPEHAFKFSAEGFITYCKVTSQLNLIDSLLRQLFVLGIFSKSARKRYSILKKTAEDSKLNQAIESSK